MRPLLAALMTALLASPVLSEELLGPPWEYLALANAWEELGVCADMGLLKRSDAEDIDAFLGAWVQAHDEELPRAQRDAVWQMLQEGEDMDGPPTSESCKQTRKMLGEKFGVVFRSLQSPF